MTKTTTLFPTVLTIALCGLLQGQTPQTDRNNGCLPQTLSFHDAPIIISDSSIAVTFDTTYFADLTQPTWGTVLTANRQLAGALLSHTHATCPNMLAPNDITLLPGQCACTCQQGGPGAAPPHHYLVVATPAAVKSYPLYDCDSLQIYLDQQDIKTKKWQLMSTKVYAMMQYVPGFNHDYCTPQVQAGTSSPYPLSQQQAWVILPWDETGTVPSLWQTGAPSGPKYESASNIRLSRVEIWSHTQGQPLSAQSGHHTSIPLANSCSAMEITAETMDPSKVTLPLPCPSVQKGGPPVVGK